MNSWTYIAENETDTVALGRALSSLLANGATVALIGNLGAGKTRLVQAFCAAEGIDSRDVVSPTFVLVHEYQGWRPVYHFDAYRLKDDDEFLALGPEEYFDGGGISFVEWADRVVDCLPRTRLEISIDVLGPTRRRFAFQELGDEPLGVVGQLASRM